MLPTAFVSHEHCALHDAGWGHPEHQGRLPAIVRALQREMPVLHPHILQVEAVPAGEDDLLLVHGRAYLERIRERAREAGEAGASLPFEHGVVVSGASWNAARAAAGAAITGAERVLAREARNAFCATRPPGRGAGAERAGEHSLLNSVAIAAVHLRVRRHIPRVLVVDLGARPALGTPGLLAEMDGVRLVTVHGPATPVSGEPFSPHACPANVYDCSLSAGATGAEVEGSLREALGLATSGWRPDFVLVSMGFDVLATDPLGTLAVEVGEIHALTRALMEVAEHAGGRLVSLLEGGYDAPAAALGVVQHLRALAGVAAG